MRLTRHAAYRVARRVHTAGLVAAALLAVPNPAAAQNASAEPTSATFLPPRLGPVALTVTSVEPGGHRLAGLVVAPGVLPAAAAPRRWAALTGPPEPCTGPCLPTGRRDDKCEDADGDRRCDIVFDPQGRGGFWRSLGRYLLLSWLWGGDQERTRK